jgi:predicted esterase
VTPSTYGDDATTAAPPAFKTTANITCHPIADGTSSVTVNGRTRKFEVKLPADRTSKAAILFEWHGFMQNAAEFMNTIVYDPPAGQWKPFDPNAFDIPLITIAPLDQNLIPIWGLDWDIVSGEKDFPFFEAMLTCIEEQFNVDTRRVYSFGFSAGAVFTNLLAAAYPKLWAATIAESGMWYNDRSQWSNIIVPGTGTVFMKWKWPALDPGDGGAVLLTHGGPNDFATVADLEGANIKAVPFLTAAGRDVTECTHEFGHTLEPDLTQAMLYQFMWDHELGGARPAALTAGMPTPEKPLFNTRCKLHRAP